MTSVFGKMAKTKQREPTYNWIKRIDRELNKVYKTPDWDNLKDNEKNIIRFANNWNRNKLQRQWILIQKYGVGYPADFKGTLGIFRRVEKFARKKLGDIRSQLNLSLDQAKQVYENI